MPKSASPASPGPVDRAAEHGDLEVLRIRGEPLLDPLGKRLHADVVAAAARARDHDRAALAQPERLEDLERGLDLLDRVRRQRDAKRVADAVDEQRAHADRGLDRARERRAGLGHAEMERIRDTLGETAVRADHRRHVARLHRDLEIAEVEALEQPHLLERGFDERVGLILLREVVQMLRQRAGVGPDAHRNARLLRGAHDEGDLVGTPDVAGIDAHGGDAGLDRLQGEAGVEVDVGDHRNRGQPDDARQRFRVFELRHSDADDLAAGRRERRDLAGRRLDVVRLRERHRLHDDGRSAADRDAADLYLTRAGHRDPV